MPAPLLAIFASLSWGVADFLGGFTARRMSVLAVLAASQPAGLVVVLGVFSWQGAGLPTGAALGWAVAAGFASVFSLGMLYLALARGRMVLVAPLAATGVSLPVLFGLLSGDPITPTLVLGIVLAVLGTIAVTLGGESEDGERSDRSDEAGNAERASRRAGRRADLVAALCALGSAAGQGSFLTLLDHASNDANPFSATVVMRVTSCILAVLLFVGYLGWRRIRPTEPTEPTGDGDPDGTGEPRRQAGPAYAVVSATASEAGGPSSSAARRPAPAIAAPAGTAPRRISRALTVLALAVVGAGVADALAEIAFASASSRGHLSVIAVLSEQYPTITMLLALTVLRERARLLQYVGAVSALAGVLLLSLGWRPASRSQSDQFEGASARCNCLMQPGLLRPCSMIRICWRMAVCCRCWSWRGSSTSRDWSRSGSGSSGGQQRRCERRREGDECAGRHGRRGRQH